MEYIYRAKDGKEFDNEMECLHYEDSLFLAEREKKTPVMFDYEFHIITLEDFMEDTGSLFCIYCRNKEEFTTINEIFNNAAVEYLREWYGADDNENFFMWDNCYDWVNITKKITEWEILCEDLKDKAQ